APGNGVETADRNSPPYAKAPAGRARPRRRIAPVPGWNGAVPRSDFPEGRIAPGVYDGRRRPRRDHGRCAHAWNPRPGRAGRSRAAPPARRGVRSTPPTPVVGARPTPPWDATPTAATSPTRTPPGTPRRDRPGEEEPQPAERPVPGRYGPRRSPLPAPARRHH